MVKKLLKSEEVCSRSVMTRSAIRRERKDNIEVVKFFEENNNNNNLVKETLPTIIIPDNEKKKKIKYKDEEKESLKVFEIIKEQKKIYDEILKSNRSDEDGIVVSYNKKKVINNGVKYEEDFEFILNEGKSVNCRDDKIYNIYSCNDKEIEKNKDNKKENEKIKKTISIEISKEEDTNVSSKDRCSILMGDEKYNTIQELINDARIRRKMSESNRRH